MIPVKLKLSNFTSYGENISELDFTKFHLAAISGPNGAGKSSLLDAITWCIWGWSRAGDSSDELIHLGASYVYVEFSFELDNHNFIVKRRRSKKGGGQTALELWSGKNNLTEGTIKATQEKIINLLHLTFETFTNSSFLRQGHADEFTTKGPTDRKRILADILGLISYDELEEKAREKVKEVDSKLKLLEYQLLEIEAELSQKDERQKELVDANIKVSATENQIKVLEEEAKILQKEKETIILVLEQQTKLEQNLKMQTDELEQIISQGKARAERIKNLELRVKNAQGLDKKIEALKRDKTELDSLKSLNQKKLELEKFLSDVNSKLSLKLQQKNQIREEIKKLTNQLKDLSKEGAKCPTCGQEIDKDRRHKVADDLGFKIKELGKRLAEIKTKQEEDEIKKLEQNLAILEVDSIKLKELEKLLSQMDALQSQKEKNLQDKATLETEQKTVEDLRILYKNKAVQVKKLADELKALPKISGDKTQVIIKLQEKENQLENLRSEERKARDLLGRATELISRSEQLEKLFKQKQQEKSSLQKMKEAFEELTLAFGKKGIQAMIIETAIPEIETDANKLLQRLTDGRMQVRFETQRETKTLRLRSGQANGEKIPGIIETLDIIISDEMGERNYELYSGGEAFRVNLAIRLALSKLLTRRAGAKLQFLVIDEGFGTQDQEGRTKIIEVLDTIKNDFEKILIITHLEELEEEFPVRIEVSKGTSGSTFELRQ